MTLPNRGIGFTILGTGMVAGYYRQAIKVVDLGKLILTAGIGTPAAGVRL